MKCTYLISQILEIAVWLPRGIRIPFVLVAHVGGLILYPISFCLSRVYHLQYFPFFVSFASVTRADKNRWFGLQNLSWKQTGRSQMQFLWVKDRCEPCIFHLLRDIQLVGLVVYVANDFLWPSVFYTERFAISPSKMPCIHIHHISDLVFWVWLTVLIGPVGLLLL